MSTFLTSYLGLGGQEDTQQQITVTDGRDGRLVTDSHVTAEPLTDGTTLTEAVGWGPLLYWDVLTSSPQLPSPQSQHPSLVHNQVLTL